MTSIPIEKPDWQAVFFQKLIQFFLANSILDSPASNIDAFLLRDTCVSSIELSRPIWNKMWFSPL
jgi:hypothetical protein